MDSKLKLKLLVDSAQRKVLFAEAGKDAVDFLFSILVLPLGEVVRLLTQESMVGSLGRLYSSVESLDDTYVQADRSKTHLLTPRVVSPAFAAGAALTWKKEGDDPSSTPATYYWCGSHAGLISDDTRAVCRNCGRNMTHQVTYVPPPSAGKAAGTSAAADSSGGGVGGLVKGVVTYMVMDDLVVSPMSAFSIITLLNKCGVKDVGSLEEMTVDLDITKGLEMLKASLQSTTVLTDVFLPKNLKRDLPSDRDGTDL